VWDNASLLVQFRNKFMHFKPAWDREKDIHDGDFVKRMKERLPTHRAFQTGFQFPFGLLTYDCSKWAVESVLAFSKYFSALIKMHDRFASKHLNYSLP
jgi:hypothetical protein